MRSLYLLIRTEFLSLVGSTNRKGKTPFVVAAILLIVFGLLMIGTMAFTGGVTAYELVKKPLTVRFAELLGAKRVCWTSRLPGDELDQDTVIFEGYHPAGWF